MRIDDYQERLRPIGVLYVDAYPFVFDHDGAKRFLLLRRSRDVVNPGAWQAVSGKIAKDERIEHAFTRQVQKKTGTTPQQLFKLSRVSTFYDEYYDTVMIVPAVGALMPVTDVTIDEELHVEFGWFAAKEARAMLQFSSQRKAIRAINRSLALVDGEPRVSPDQDKVVALLESGLSSEA